MAGGGTRLAGVQETTPEEKGEQLLNGSCGSCHDLRPVDLKALDEEGWTKVVKSMIDEGAEIKTDDVPLLVDYLVKHHGPLPEGPGKEILLNRCTPCHDLQRVRRQGRSAQGWLEILEAMLNEGASLSDEELGVLLPYLSRNFSPKGVDR
jgi:hypothetical protein